MAGKNQYLGIGLMSGSSMDGLDIACCRFTEEENRYDFEMVASKAVPFPEKWKGRLMHLRYQAAEIYAKTDVYYAHWMGSVVREFIRRHDLKPDFVASHGQTIFHQPHKNFTAQIGDGETFVSYLDCPLVSNFRNKDVALGGEGAPLVTIGEKYLFHDHHLFLNLGGFCNLTHETLAFDISPCNIVLNHLALMLDHEPALEFDPDGQHAASGALLEDLLETLNALPYFHKNPPKSLGWEWVEGQVIPLFSDPLLHLPSVMHTYCVHIAQQISRAVEAVGIRDENLMVTGGGRHNTFLMSQIEAHLRPFGIEIDHEVSSELTDFKEAIVFAFLGLRVLTGKSTALHTVTGAPFDNLSGAIHLPPKGGFRLLRYEP